SPTRTMSSSILPQSLSPVKRHSFSTGSRGSRPVTSAADFGRTQYGGGDDPGFQNSLNSWAPDDDSLAIELASRSTTHEGTLRKMTIEASANLSKTASNSIDFDENRFLPKVKKVRPDGATLTDVYMSKKEDIWGKILREQIIEEDRMNSEKRRNKERADAEYGRLLSEQVVTKDRIDATVVHPGDALMNSKGGTWAQFEQRNIDRQASRHKKHAEFVSNALYDMSIKKQRQQQELMQELESSAFLVQKSQMEMALESEKQREFKRQKALEQEKLWDENQAILAKRAAERELKNQMDKAYVREQDEKFQLQEERRQAERDMKAASNSTNRGAFVLAKKVYDEAKRKEEKLYRTILEQPNSLSEQLKTSEEATQRRIEATQERLRQEFIRQRQIDSKNRDTRAEDEAKVRAAMEDHQRRFLQSQNRQRNARQEAAAKYQIALDEQLGMNRQRALHALK
ncbi:unnamed protein product, partial [Symbiodinium microadriaticum]